MNWAYFAIAVSAVVALIWLVLLLRARRKSLIAFYVSIGFLIMAALNAAAPIRGAVDPAYVGYAFGLLHASRGLEVTAIAGTVFLVSVLCAFITACNRRGPGLWLVAAASAAMLVIEGWPWVEQVIADPAGNVIQLGEYLTIPGLVASGLLGLFLVGPFLVGVPWAIHSATQRRRREPA
jgi:hypothetical protein